MLESVNASPSSSSSTTLLLLLQRRRRRRIRRRGEINTINTCCEASSTRQPGAGAATAGRAEPEPRYRGAGGGGGGGGGGAVMETDGEQNQQTASTNGSTASGSTSRPSPMNSMSLYERQAVQALQALQRQPNAAQYFQQLMLQQQINNAQLQNLAAVQQATLAASRQSSPSSSSSSSQTTSTASTSVTAGSGSAPSSRPTVASATSTISQSVLLSGTAAGQGQMYLRVNRSLRAPISSQLIFMPGNTATTAVATITQQQQPQAQQQQPEVTPPTSSSISCHSDNEQVQNLAMRGVACLKGVGVKTEAPDRSDSAYSLTPPSHQSNTQSHSKPPPPQPPHIKIPTYPQPTNLKAHASSFSSSSSSSSSIPLSQLLLHGTRTLATGGSAPTAAHTLVLTSSAASQPHGYPVGTATIKPAVGAQTLVVQPLQKTSLGAADKPGGGPIPIQPKTLQGLRLPLQLPSRNPPPILPAPPPSAGSAQTPQAPHIPVQIVGARQSTLGNAQALALARGSCSQDGAAALSSSSSLLTMVASIASREGGVMGRGGVGLKALQSPQEVPQLAQVSQVHPQANQSAAQGQNGTLASGSASAQPGAVSSSLSRSSLSLALTTEEQRGAVGGVTANRDSTGSQTPQVKHVSGSLKRKSDSNSANDEDGPSPPRIQPVRDHASVLPTNPVKAGSVAPPLAPPSPVLSVSRGGGGQTDRAPPPQAVVKPHVLTHLIEGFVIQEGAEPFPVCGSVKDSSGEDLTNDSQTETVTTATVLKCEYCKNFAPAAQFRGTKRFCSMSCAKRYNVSFRQHFCMRQGHGQGHGQGLDGDQGHGQLSNSDEEGGIARRRVPRRTSSEIASAKIAGRPLPVKCRSESSHSDEESSPEDDEDDPMSLSPASSASCHQPPPPPPPLPEGSPPGCLLSVPAQWSVQEVSQFISSLQGCEDLASQFLSQEIDGQALLLLKEEHLMSTMNIKLGPALKICAHINTLRD
ncbi:polyhomeotic-like protein 1 isoform X2 [Solea solea]|uniref:polyhomeotic-like protein 1 isoform X2 n=1 Tax=Solea solea TaxID=90069 RepID=UPI00272B5128|nr:polyhomeotic-like protein 1 isoform X2 [Solea solea]